MNVMILLEQTKTMSHQCSIINFLYIVLKYVLFIDRNQLLWTKQISEMNSQHERFIKGYNNFVGTSKDDESLMFNHQFFVYAMKYVLFIDRN